MIREDEKDTSDLRSCQTCVSRQRSCSCPTSSSPSLIKLCLLALITVYNQRTWTMRERPETSEGNEGRQRQEVLNTLQQEGELHYF